jgi:hypothetical protein
MSDNACYQELTQRSGNLHSVPEKGEQRQKWYGWVVRFALLCLGCVLASALGFVLLPTIEIHTTPLRSFNLSGYIGMFTFALVVFALEAYRGRSKSAWPQCSAALACAMLITFRTWWIIGIY